MTNAEINLDFALKAYNNDQLDSDQEYFIDLLMNQERVESLEDLDYADRCDLKSELKNLSSNDYNTLVECADAFEEVEQEEVTEEVETEVVNYQEKFNTQRNDDSKFNDISKERKTIVVAGAYDDNTDTDEYSVAYTVKTLTCKAGTQMSQKTTSERMRTSKTFDMNLDEYELMYKVYMYFRNEYAEEGCNFSCFID